MKEEDKTWVKDKCPGAAMERAQWKPRPPSIVSGTTVTQNWGWVRSLKQEPCHIAFFQT